MILLLHIRKSPVVSENPPDIPFFHLLRPKDSAFYLPMQEINRNVRESERSAPV